MKHTIRTTLLCLTLIIAGCGFHLRGHTTLPPQLQILYIESHNPYSPFYKALTRHLDSAGVTLVDTAVEAPMTLYLGRDTYHARMVTVGGSNQTREYHLTYAIQFQLRDPDGRAITPMEVISVSRRHISNANQILGNSNEEELLKAQMQDELIYKLLLRLSSRKNARMIAGA